MKNSFKIALFSFITVLAVGLADTALGQTVKDTSFLNRNPNGDNESYQGFREDKMLRKMTKRLGLSADQQEKLKLLKSSDTPDFHEKRKAMKDAHDKLEEAMKGNATEDEVRGQFADLEKLQSDFARARLEKVLAIRAILTPEQRMKFKGMGHGEFHKKRRRH